MYVALYTNKPVKSFTKKMAKYGVFVETYTLPDPEWTRDRLSNSYIHTVTAKHFEDNGETTDVVMFLLDEWHAPGLLGRIYYWLFNRYLVTYVKYRRRWEDTAEHELLHAANWFVNTYLSVSLSRVFGVQDFDEDIVHGRHPDYTEYEYEKVWERTKPILNSAIQKRKRMAILSVQHQLLARLKEYVAYLQGKIEDIKDGEHPLISASKRFVGRDASPSDLAPDELGCAESLSQVIRSVLPTFPIVTGTWTLWDVLREDKSFKQVRNPQPGDIIISPTGTGNGRIPGHAGIVGDGIIYSNDSNTGTWQPNFRHDTWQDRYEETGGYPTYFYRLKT